jgi:hypothetical protein
MARSCRDLRATTRLQSVGYLSCGLLAGLELGLASHFGFTSGLSAQRTLMIFHLPSNFAISR